MDSIGETLRQARHTKKATLEDIARATKVKIDILEKLEADDFTSLAGPMYTKGFLKIYAEYLGLDSAGIVDAYLKSQGGLRRQGLQLQTESAIRSRKPGELQLSLDSVVRLVAGVSLAVVVTLGGYYYFTHRRSAPVIQTKSAAPPVAGFEAYYQPKTKPAPELLEVPTKP